MPCDIKTDVGKNKNKKQKLKRTKTLKSIGICFLLSPSAFQQRTPTNGSRRQTLEICDAFRFICAAFAT